MSAKDQPEKFADMLLELETLVKKLENDDTPLEESLQDFQSGISLIRLAQKSLSDAEQKIQQLLEVNGELVTEPLDNAGDEA